MVYGKYPCKPMNRQAINKDIRIAIADDYELFRKGMVMLLERYKKFNVIIEAKNGAELLKKMEKRAVDVVVLDYQMPEIDGLEATKRIKKKFPGAKIIVLTFYNDHGRITNLVKEGASGFLLKNAEIETIVDAIHTVADNDYYFNDHIPSELIKKLFSKTKLKGIEDSIHLTDREIEIIQLICKENTTREIAEKLCVSSRTVEGYREKIIQKLRVKNTAGIIIYAIIKKIAV